MNKLAEKIHKDNVAKGWYDEPRETGTMLMLCVSELAEACEADRKGRYANLDQFESVGQNTVSNLTAEGWFKTNFNTNIKDTFEDELADTMIRILDICAHRKIDIEKHINLKLKYNRLRAYKHGNKKY